MEKIRNLIDYLNDATRAYNEGKPFITDKEWDDKYFELSQIEKETGIIYSDSPTQSIYYDVVDSFEKVNHNPPMLSLAKTKDVNEIKNFIKDKDYIVSLKMDGLSCRLEYNNGELIMASTRGTGEIGDLVTTNVRVCQNVPKCIPYPNHLVIDGEIIIAAKDFEPFTQEYKNPRNLAAGSLKLLDSGECAKRHLSFVAWDIINQGPGVLSGRLKVLSGWGFTIVPFIVNDFDKAYTELPELAKDLGYPIDGLVIKYDDVKYYRSLGTTSHHPAGALALKFYDEEFETTLKDIEWQVGRTGQITPVAIFNPVDTGDSVIEKASLHNLTIMKNLLGKPYVGQSVKVIKSNMIIPQVVEADKTPREDNSDFLSIPEVCPVCGKPVTIKNDTESEFLICSNPECEGKFINKVVHFVGKKGLDIKGISKATLEKLMDWGWLNTISDIFKLQEHRNEWIKKPGFGVKSVDNILNAIESSRQCDLDKFIAALGIPIVGSSAAKDLAKQFGTWLNFIEAVDDDFAFYNLPNFGPEMHSAIMKFDFSEAEEIAETYLTFNETSTSSSGTSSLSGKTFVITGKTLTFKNRDELKAKIESLGGKVAGSVSGKTDYLINNDSGSGSTKNLKAKELGVSIITEEEFINQFGI